MSQDLSKFEMPGVEKFGTPEWTRVFDGVRAEFQFANGWGASIIQHSGSYGGNSELTGYWELAVLDSTGELRYDTPITGGVLGWQSVEEIAVLLGNIEMMAPEGTDVVPGELAE